MAFKQIHLGILGGGQLGKMLIQAAADWNVYVKVLDPAPDAPCRALAHEFVCGALTDYQTVVHFGQDVDILTIEIEHVNVQALETLQAQGKRVYPDPQWLQIIQDKRLQKQFYQAHQIPTAPFVLTENRADVARYADRLPAVHKLGKEGYDGRGVQKINTIAELPKAFDAPSVLEQHIDFEKELSVIVARNRSGQMEVFPVVEMVFHPEHNLVEYLFAPANVPATIAHKAQKIAEQIVATMGYVGLLAVEMFLTKQGEILVNEIAPRPHNSGHHTIEANYTSQYQQLLRAIFDFPLGDTTARCPAAMVNLLGEPGYTGEAVYKGIEKVLALPGVYVHLYGKTITKPFRKMGHVTILATAADELAQKVALVKQRLKVIGEQRTAAQTSEVIS
ncbi:MAG: 5-(carboxyamino)imidazole ribonucleotide synthase [Cytophagales bacterium]|nr:5-(carboxyamino)imidazole ribonucleotide synthase [Bernardetiaceae bacterium]MDW8205643.1 5-(carboxyamino)imidazole ribonucleotide synthase [Cytophagales bacterium]